MPSALIGLNGMGFFKELLSHTDPHILMIRGEARGPGKKLIIRFQNGLGVEILNRCLPGEPPLFVVTVIRFLGTRIKDYQPAQYVPIPEVNWLHHPEEIMDLCRQVACLPARRADSREWEEPFSGKRKVA